MEDKIQMAVARPSNEVGGNVPGNVCAAMCRMGWERHRQGGRAEAGHGQGVVLRFQNREL